MLIYNLKVNLLDEASHSWVQPHFTFILTNLLTAYLYCMYVSFLAFLLTEYWSPTVSSHAEWKCFSIFSPPCTQTETRETLLGFNMVNYRACKNLWKACVEHHTFFRLERPIPPQKNFFAHYFTLGSKFRYWWEREDTHTYTYTPRVTWRESAERTERISEKFSLDFDRSTCTHTHSETNTYMDQTCGWLVWKLTQLFHFEVERLTQRNWESK